MRQPLLTSLKIALVASALLLCGCAGHTSDMAFDSNGSVATSLHATNAPDQPDGVTYHYYPNQEVYYDPQREVYFWHASAYWGVGRRLPSTIKLDKAERTLITLDTRTPYRRHDEVLARHPGTGRTVVSVPTDRD